MKLLTKQILIQDMLILIVLLIIDLVSKYFFFNQKVGSETFFLEPAMNRGISFSMTMSLEIVIIMTVFSLILFGYMYAKVMFPRIAIIFLLGGTLGNFYDRIFYDGVRDFIVVPEWFICNIADVFLCMGMIWACVYLLIDHNKKSKIYHI